MDSSRFWASPIGWSVKLYRSASAITVGVLTVRVLLTVGTALAAADVRIYFPVASGQESSEPVGVVPGTRSRPQGRFGVTTVLLGDPTLVRRRSRIDGARTMVSASLRNPSRSEPPSRLTLGTGDGLSALAPPSQAAV
jgi:hypothetical protein